MSYNLTMRSHSSVVSPLQGVVGIGAELAMHVVSNVMSCSANLKYNRQIFTYTTIHKYTKETNADTSGSHKCNSKAHGISYYISNG